MVNLFRRFQQPLMIIITILVIVSFAWFYNRSDFMDRGATDRVGSIYGRNFTQAQYLREGRKFDLCQALAPELWQALIQPATTQDEALNNYVWNSLVLREESERLGIRPTDADIEQGIKNVPLFQTNGVYDSSKYNNLVAGALGARGLTPDALEQLMGDEVRLTRLKALLGTTLAPGAEEVRSIFELRHGQFQCSVVRFDFNDFLKAQQVSDEDVKKEFEARKASLKTDELRKVKYVAFTVENVEKPLVGKERVDAFAKLSEKAQEFMVAMTEPNAKFEDVAAKLGATIKESSAFSEQEPPKELDQSAKAAEAAFKLTKDQPNSDAVQTEKGYLLLQLAEVTPAREKTFDEARAELTDTLKGDRANETMTLKAADVRTKIEADLKAGKNFAEAATAAGVKAEMLPAVSLADPSANSKNIREVAITARDLQPGQVSAFVPTMGGGSSVGGILVYLEKILPIDEKAFTDSKETIADEISRAMHDGIFRQWFSARRAAANVLLVRAPKS